IERIAAGERPARQGVADDIEIAGENFRARRAVPAKGCESRRVSAGPASEFETAVRQQIEHRGVLRHPHGIFQRERDDAGPEANATGLRSNETEKGKRRGKTALAFVKMMLSNPCGIKACAFRVPDLRCGQAISVRWSGIIKKPREEAQSLRTYRTLHRTLRTGTTEDAGPAAFRRSHETRNRSNLPSYRSDAFYRVSTRMFSHGSRCLQQSCS